MTTDVRDPSWVGDGLSIQRVSTLLGIPAPTIRSWERRYGLPTTLRSTGGHRRYSSDALNELRLMRDEIAQGKRAADAARSVRQLLDQTDPAVAWINQLLAASVQLESGDVRAVLDNARDEIGLAATIDHVLMPAMRQIGTWWEAGRCDIAQEHLTTEVARGWLARLTAFAPEPTSNAPILLACGPQDLHSLGLEALAALLAYRHRACRVLGARTPKEALVDATIRTGAIAVVVVSHQPTHRRETVDALRAVAETGCPVFYAGNAFLFPGARVGVPGTYLGDSLSLATELILKSLPAHVAD